MDRLNGEIFDISVTTLIHLGAKVLRLYPSDLKNEKTHSDAFVLLGRPSLPASFAWSFNRFTEWSECDKITRVHVLNEYKLMLTSDCKSKKKKEKHIECEGMFHYLL